MEPEETIGFLVKTISNLFGRQLHEGSQQTTRMQNWIMGYLYRCKQEEREVYQKDIERFFNIRRSTATGILQGMEKNGWIQKEPVKNDARLKRLILTKKAEIMQERLIAEMMRLEDEARKGIPQEEIDAFVRTAHKMIDNLKENEKGGCRGL